MANTVPDPSVSKGNDVLRLIPYNPQDKTSNRARLLNRALDNQPSATIKDFIQSACEVSGVPAMFPLLIMQGEYSSNVDSMIKGDLINASGIMAVGSTLVPSSIIERYNTDRATQYNGLGFGGDDWSIWYDNIGKYIGLTENTKSKWDSAAKTRIQETPEEMTQGIYGDNIDISRQLIKLFQKGGIPNIEENRATGIPFRRSIKLYPFRRYVNEDGSELIDARLRTIGNLFTSEPGTTVKGGWNGVLRSATEWVFKIDNNYSGDNIRVKLDRTFVSYSNLAQSIAHMIIVLRYKMISRRDYIRKELELDIDNIEDVTQAMRIFLHITGPNEDGQYAWGTAAGYTDDLSNRIPKWIGYAQEWGYSGINVNIIGRDALNYDINTNLAYLNRRCL